MLPKAYGSGGASGSAARGKPGRDGATPVIGANGNWFINGVDTKHPARAAQDLSSFKPNEVVVVDSKGELKPSGVFATDGDIHAEPDSVTIGSHEISSSAENVLVTNLATQKRYAPLWQEIAPDAKQAFIRAHDSIETVHRYTGTTRRYVNPVFDITMDENQTSFVVHTYAAQAATNVVLEVYQGQKKLARSKWDSVEKGAVSLVLNSPLDFKKGVVYTVHIKSPDGDVILKGGGRGPNWAVDRVKWADIEIATQEWVNDTVSSLTTEVRDNIAAINGLYAKDRASFDAAVTALIEAKMKGSPATKTIPKIYALFSNTIPTSLASNAIVESASGEASLSRTDTTSMRLCVLVENDKGEADRVSGFSVDGGLSSSWVRRDTTIDGKKYAAFFSAGAYREMALSVRVVFL